MESPSAWWHPAQANRGHGKLPAGITLMPRCEGWSMSQSLQLIYGCHTLSMAVLLRRQQLSARRPDIDLEQCLLIVSIAIETFSLTCTEGQCYIGEIQRNIITFMSDSQNVFYLSTPADCSISMHLYCQYVCRAEPKLVFIAICEMNPDS